MTQKLWVIKSASKIKINDPGIMRLATADNSVMTIRVITFWINAWSPLFISWMEKIKEYFFMKINILNSMKIQLYRLYINGFWNWFLDMSHGWARLRRFEWSKGAIWSWNWKWTIFWNVGCWSRFSGSIPFADRILTFHQIRSIIITTSQLLIEISFPFNFSFKRRCKT